ncbi:MAG: hypothetical protein EBY57_04165 [Actinobacteria bacterium]|nr:hypothetical protein [Actinomycetota bacterium]
MPWNAVWYGIHFHADSYPLNAKARAIRFSMMRGHSKTTTIATGEFLMSTPSPRPNHDTMIANVTRATKTLNEWSNQPSTMMVAPRLFNSAAPRPKFSQNKTVITTVVTNVPMAALLTMTFQRAGTAA